jgi:predicted small secreted protein
MKFKFISISLAFITLLGLASCNTVSGMGQDLQKGGRALQDAAD